MFYLVSLLLSRSLVEAAVFGDAAAGGAVLAWLPWAGEADVDEVGAPEPAAGPWQAVGVVGAWRRAGNDIRRGVHFAAFAVVAGRLFGR